MRLNRRHFLLLGSTAALAWPSFAAGKTEAGRIYFGGDIVTMNDAATKDGRIIGIGTRAEIETVFKGGATEMIDLAGKTLMPGFIDAHSQYINALLVADQAQVYAPPSGPGKDMDGIIAAIKAFATGRNIPKGDLIVA